MASFVTAQSFLPLLVGVRALLKHLVLRVLSGPLFRTCAPLPLQSCLTFCVSHFHSLVWWVSSLVAATWCEVRWCGGSIALVGTVDCSVGTAGAGVAVCNAEAACVVSVSSRPPAVTAVPWRSSPSLKSHLEVTTGVAVLCIPEPKFKSELELELELALELELEFEL